MLSFLAVSFINTLCIIQSAWLKSLFQYASFMLQLFQGKFRTEAFASSGSKVSRKEWVPFKVVVVSVE